MLYTNHLPKVGAIDKGTWRRLIVIPFEAKIEGSDDIKNFADYLFENAGSAILSWVIKGAKMVIEDNYHIEPPKKVQDAITLNPVKYITHTVRIVRRWVTLFAVQLIFTLPWKATVSTVKKLGIVTLLSVFD